MTIYDDFRAQLDIVEVAESLTGVTSTGPDGAKILCPFHHEKTPSCYLYRSDNHFHCFGCNEHGDIFKLVQALRECSFAEAVDWLAETFGVTRPALNPKTEAKSIALRTAKQWFVEGLADVVELPFGLDRGLALKLGLGRAIKVDELRIKLPYPLLSRSEVSTWEGHWTLELYNSRGNLIGFGIFKEALPNGTTAGAPSSKTTVAHFAPADAAKFDLAFVGLLAARKTINHKNALLLAPGPADMLQLQAAGVRSVIALASKFDNRAAKELVSLANRVILLVPAGADANAYIESAFRLLRAGGRPWLASAEALPINPVSLFTYLSARATQLSNADRESLLTRYLNAVPSATTRALYRAELIKRGLLP